MSHADETIPRPLQAVPSRLTLRDLGLLEEDLPVLDPEKGGLRIDGKEVPSGGRVYLYNSKGEPLFGFTVVDGAIQVAPHAAARSVAAACLGAAGPAVAEPAAEARAAAAAEAETADSARPAAAQEEIPDAESTADAGAADSARPAAAQEEIPDAESAADAGAADSARPAAAQEEIPEAESGRAPVPDAKAAEKGEETEEAEEAKEAEEAQESEAEEETEAEEAEKAEEAEEALPAELAETVADASEAGKARGDGRPRTEAERRARAMEQAARGRAQRTEKAPRPRIRGSAKPAPKSPLAPLLMMSTFTCIVLVVLFSFNIFGLKDRFYGQHQSGSGEDAESEMTFESGAFSPAEMDFSEPQAECIARLQQQGWQVNKPEEDSEWVMRKDGVIDNGEMDRPGAIQLERSGKQAFRLAVESGFLALPGAKPDRQSNLTLMLHAPSQNAKASFGFGKEMGQAFIVLQKGQRKDTPRRHDMPIEYNRWYQLRVEADGTYVNFYFNGKKLDSVELEASRVTHIALTTFRSRALFRNFELKEQGVKRGTPPTRPQTLSSEAAPVTPSKK
ncbi:MAG: hypothetical protein HYU36_02615 [Planctomycetes bacterium]|nr:hypothetical protein [Planctomycetota bacterium]